jgi:hypothetical protein
MQQSSQLGTVASAHLVGALKLLLECQEALLPIAWRAGIGLLDRLTLASRGPLLKAIDDEGEEEGYGKDGDKKVHDQPEIHQDAGPQVLNPGEQALPESGWVLAGIEALEIPAGGRDIEEPGTEFLLGLGRWISRTPECPEPCPRAGTGGVQQELAERSGHHRAGKRRPARQTSWLYRAGDVL